MNILVIIQAKKVPIHQGHIELINFAKTLGDVTVQVNYDTLGYSSYLDTGVKGSPEEGFPDQKKVFESVDVNLVENKLLDGGIFEDDRIKLREACWARVNAMNLNLPENLIQRVFKAYVSFIGSHIKNFKQQSKYPKYDQIVLGPEIEHFYLKYLFKNMIAEGKRSNYKKDSITIFPKTVLDEYGLRYRSVYPDDFLPYLNIMRTDRKTLQIYNHQIYEGEIFLNGKLEITIYTIPITGDDKQWPPVKGSILWTEEIYAR